MGSPRALLAGALAGVSVSIALASPGAHAAPARSTASYTVVAATASASLSFSGGTPDSRASGKATLTVTRRGGSGRASFAAGRGSARVAISARNVERATIRERPNPSSPYVEQQCGNSKTQRTSGGLVFRPLGGGRVEVRWGFPHARMQRCPARGRSGRARESARSYRRRGSPRLA